MRTILEYGPKDGYRLARQECHGRDGNLSFFEGHCAVVREIHANAQLEENPRLAIFQAADLELSRHGININSVTNQHIDLVEKICSVDLSDARVYM